MLLIRNSAYLRLKLFIQAAQSQILITKHRNTNGTTIIQLRQPDGTFGGDAGQLLKQLQETDLVLDSIPFDKNIKAQAIEIISSENSNEIIESKLKNLGVPNAQIAKVIESKEKIELAVQESNAYRTLYKAKVATDIFNWVNNNYKDEKTKKRFIEGMDSSITMHGPDWQKLDKNGKAIYDISKQYEQTIEELKTAKTESQVLDILSRAAGYGIDLSTTVALFIGIPGLIELSGGAGLSAVAVKVLRNHVAIDSAKVIADQTDAVNVIAQTLDPHLMGVIVGGMLSTSITLRNEKEFEKLRKELFNENLYSKYKKFKELIQEVKNADNINIDLASLEEIL